jgi:thymidylate synthase
VTFALKDITDISQFTSEDIELIGYEPHPKILMEMSV